MEIHNSNQPGGSHTCTVAAATGLCRRLVSQPLSLPWMGVAQFIQACLCIAWHNMYVHIVHVCRCVIIRIARSTSKQVYSYLIEMTVLIHVYSGTSRQLRMHLFGGGGGTYSKV